jgi:hypothetical protein
MLTDRNPFTLIFKPGPPREAEVPVPIRLRMLLKYALRALNLKCLRVTPTAEDPLPEKGQHGASEEGK